MHTSELLFSGLEDIYLGGQASGEFRQFDARVMAVTHQAAVEAMIAYWSLHPEVDLDAYARSLSGLLVHAVSSESRGADG
jgi:TetR/AcrR family transcriptional regulator, fatty acid metabolism regulator protein